MTTFKEIRGTAIQSVSSDPTNPEVGQIWYNNTIGVLKGYRSLGGVWAAGGSLPTSNHQSGGAGPQTANVIFGGTAPPANPQKTAASFEYDGSTWSPGGNLNTSRTGIAGAGTQTAALGMGGYLFPGGSNAAETYNGTSWTNVTSAPTADSYASTGTQTSALYAVDATTLEYSAPSWSVGGTLNTPRAEASMAGTQTAALFFGGGPQTAASNATEEYDGSSWTAGGTMNTARGIQIGGTGASQTAAIAFGGAGPTEPQRSAATELYDGTSWTTTGSLATARSLSSKGGSQGTSSSALCVGGIATASSSAVEEFTNPVLATQKITTS
jgi:hypothetical protein